MSGIFAGRTAQDVIASLHLQPLEGEGSWWAAGPRTRRLSSITVLLTPADDGFSAMHSLKVDEGWQWLAGAAAAMLRLGPGGRGALSSVEARTGQVLVTAGTWQGAATLGDWTLLSCWCAPAFTWEDFTLGERSDLQRDYPAWTHEIEILTRVQPPAARAQETL